MFGIGKVFANSCKVGVSLRLTATDEELGLGLRLQNLGVVEQARHIKR